MGVVPVTTLQYNFYYLSALQDHKKSELDNTYIVKFVS